MDLMRPTHSQSTDEKGQQLYMFKSEVPCFPYTQTPILPQVFYRAGLSSKEGLQEHDSVDPILVVKFPRMLRDPPSALPSGRYLRSTWILREGVWHQVEDRAEIPDSPVKFDRYVERAVFRYHPVRPTLQSAPAVEDIVQTAVPYPCGRQLVRALSPQWRAVVAALARAIHGGYRVSHCLFVSTDVPIEIEFLILDRWCGHESSRKCGRTCHKRCEKARDMARLLFHVWSNSEIAKMVSSLSSTTAPRSLVYVYKDEGSNMHVKIQIVDAPKEVAIWSLIGVDDDN